MTAITLPPRAAIEHLVTVTLATMGKTSEDVANGLRAAGIKGIRMDESCCPVARYLARLPEVRMVEVLEDHLLAWPNETGAKAINVDLPEPVIEFVSLFDEKQGPYMDLDERAVAS